VNGVVIANENSPQGATLPSNTEMVASAISTVKTACLIPFLGITLRGNSVPLSNVDKVQALDKVRDRSFLTGLTSRLPLVACACVNRL
jgi:hypothetical protein